MIKGTTQQQQNQNMKPSSVMSDVKAINTTVMLLSQKMGYLVRNEKILSKNIIVLNDKIKKLEEKVNNISQNPSGSAVNSEEIESMKAQIEELYNKVKGLRQDIQEVKTSLENLNNRFATKAELNELKYLVDAINPLEFVTYKQLKDLLGKK